METCNLGKFPIKVKYLDPSVPKISMPRGGDLGIDLYANEDKVVKKGAVTLISTGVCIQMPEGYALILKDRSSVSKHGHVLAGVLDQAYCGEIMIRMFCVGCNEYSSIESLMPGYEGFIGTPPKTMVQEPIFKINKGDKIAQAIIVPDLTYKFYIKEVEELSETIRGDKGFGSTGR